MGHFYGFVRGDRPKDVSRLGTKNSGYTSYCAGWGGGMGVTTANDTAHSNLQRTATAYSGGVLRGRESKSLGKC